MSRSKKVFQDFFEVAFQTKEEREKYLDADSFVQRVEMKAHELYEQRGYENGHDWDDWFKAEKVVEAKMSTVEKDCIRSENLYEVSHRPSPFPSDIDEKKINKEGLCGK